MNTLIKILLTLSCILSYGVKCASENPGYEGMDFDDFVQKFKKNYKNQGEKQNRRKFYNKRMQEIKRLNREEAQGVVYGVTQLADILPEEEQALLSYRIPEDQQETTPQLQQQETPSKLGGVILQLPLAYDLRSKGVVTQPKYQGTGCGSCWAFAATSAYETMWLQDGNPQKDFSEQELLQCTPPYGCIGGFGNQALQRAVTYGLSEEASFPYEPSDTFYNDSEICDPYSDAERLKLQNLGPQTSFNIIRRIYTVMGPISKEQLKKLVYDYGSVMVGVFLDTRFINYRSGIIYCTTNSDTYINHEVHLVGWGDGFWIIKNSWGPWWGEGGYARVSMSMDCEMTRFVEYAEYTIMKKTNFTITMKDSNSNGWEGTVLSIDQSGRPSKTFGGSFNSGAEITSTIELYQGQEAIVRVSVMGSRSEQIGFSMKNQDGVQYCTRKPGIAFQSTIIFCRFCPNCPQYNKKLVNLGVILENTREGGYVPIGYEGLRIGVIQEGVMTELGSQFTVGSFYAATYTLPYKTGVTVEVVAVYVPAGLNTALFGYTLTYPDLSQASHKDANKRSTPFSQGALLHSFVPQQNNLLSSFALGEDQNKQKIFSENQKTQLLSGLIAMSILFLLSIVVIFVLCVKYKSVRKVNRRRRKQFPSQSATRSFQDNTTGMHTNTYINNVTNTDP